MTNLPEEIEEEHGRLYWFYHNVKSRITGGIWSWIKVHKVATTGIVILVLYTLIANRAAEQPVILIVRKYFALVLLALVVLGIFGLYVRKKEWKGIVVPTVIAVMFVFFCGFGGPVVHNYLSLYLHYANLNKIEINTMPASGHERIQPINSIRTLINQEALSETEDATQPRFTRGKSGNYYFTSAVGPAREYWIQRLTKPMYEVLHVPAYLPSPAFTKKYRSEVNFDIGEQLMFSNNTENAVIKKFGLYEFLNFEPNEPLFLENGEGKWVQVIPITRWEGALFPHPVFGGVYVVNQVSDGDSYWERAYLGKGTYYSPQDVLNTTWLKGQNLQPQNVLEYIANSFKFANGFLAPMPGYHEGDVRIPLQVDDQNPMPFITHFNISGEAKLYNYFGLEPYEEAKKGLSLSLFIPGDTDQKIYYINHRTEKYIGSSAISAKIVESKKNYDWSVNYAAESRPFIRNINGKNRFLWLSTIVSKAGENEGEFIGGSIPELCLTDAVYGKVMWIDQDSLQDQMSWERLVDRQMSSYWDAE